MPRQSSVTGPARVGPSVTGSPDGGRQGAGSATAQPPAERAGEHPKRADARRNHDRLVAAAREVFAREGGGASMEAIARQAGVGVGTLYRHFPRRIDVVEAVYRTDVDTLVETSERVAAELEPWPALVEFLEALVRYAQGKRTFLNELHEAFDKNPDLRTDMLGRVRGAVQLVLGRAQDAGLVRADLSGADLMQLVGPMCTNATLTEEQSRRLLDVILDGLRRQA
jgi:AcrR family transcriptional regulator